MRDKNWRQVHGGRRDDTCDHGLSRSWKVKVCKKKKKKTPWGHTTRNTPERSITHTAFFSKRWVSTIFFDLTAGMYFYFDNIWYTSYLVYTKYHTQFAKKAKIWSKILLGLSHFENDEVYFSFCKIYVYVNECKKLENAQRKMKMLAFSFSDKSFGETQRGCAKGEDRPHHARTHAHNLVEVKKQICYRAIVSFTGRSPRWRIRF